MSWRSRQLFSLPRPASRKAGRLKKLNFDNRFILRIIGNKQQSDSTDDRVVAFCWYQPDEWEKLKQTAADAENLDDLRKQSGGTVNER